MSNNNLQNGVHGQNGLLAAQGWGSLQLDVAHQDHSIGGITVSVICCSETGESHHSTFMES